MPVTQFQQTLLQKAERIQEVTGPQTFFSFSYERAHSPLAPRGYHAVKQVHITYMYGGFPLGAEQLCLAAVSAIFDHPLERCEVKTTGPKRITVTFN